MDHGALAASLMDSGESSDSRSGSRFSGSFASRRRRSRRPASRHHATSDGRRRHSRFNEDAPARRRPRDADSVRERKPSEIELEAAKSALASAQHEISVMSKQLGESKQLASAWESKYIEKTTEGTTMGAAHKMALEAAKSALASAEARHASGAAALASATGALDSLRREHAATVARNTALVEEQRAQSAALTTAKTTAAAMEEKAAQADERSASLATQLESIRRRFDCLTDRLPFLQPVMSLYATTMDKAAVFNKPAAAGVQLRTIACGTSVNVQWPPQQVTEADGSSEQWMAIVEVDWATGAPTRAFVKASTLAEFRVIP